MTTEIALEGRKIADWLLKKGDADYSGFTQATILSLPDKPGIYETVFGRVGLTFSSVDNGGTDESPVVVLDCSQIPILQSKNARQIRTVNLNQVGFGSQQLRDGVNLTIKTEADLRNYRSQKT